jgi:hypothetical protein
VNFNINLTLWTTVFPKPSTSNQMLVLAATLGGAVTLIAFAAVHGDTEKMQVMKKSTLATCSSPSLGLINCLSRAASLALKTVEIG